MEIKGLLLAANRRNRQLAFIKKIELYGAPRILNFIYSLPYVCDFWLDLPKVDSGEPEGLAAKVEG